MRVVDADLIRHNLWPISQRIQILIDSSIKIIDSKSGSAFSKFSRKIDDMAETITQR